MLNLRNKVLLRESAGENRLSKIYTWASRQTAETSDFSLKDYYQTSSFKKILFRLTNTQRGLYGIKGLQGTGKSTTLKALVDSLPEDKAVTTYKWNREWRKIWVDEIMLSPTYWVSLWNHVLLLEGLEKKLNSSKSQIRYDLDAWHGASDERPEMSEDDSRVKYSPKQRITNSLNAIADTERLEQLLGKSVVKEIQQNLLDQFLENCNYIFIDLPDYNKSNLQLMNKDIDELQKMWQEFADKKLKVTFLISAQKEIIMKKQHFFFGKIQWEDLQPLTPEQLLAAYEQKWQSCVPFNEDSLRMIAELSRGVFRRFLRYITLVIEAYQINGRSGLITVEDVKNAISFEVLQQDMELELSDIFVNSGQRVQAVKVLDLLRGEILTQKQIAEHLGVSEPTSGKLVAKLELYNYLKRTRSKEGKGWLVTLA